MTAQTVRLYKEARAIWWPWLLITGVGVLASMTATQSHAHRVDNPFSTFWFDGAIPIGSFLGIPLLATMIFGLDFQHRTLALLLSQPIDRMQLWKEKMLVMVAAVLPTAVIYCVGWTLYAPLWDKNNPFAVGGSPWMIAAIALIVAAAAAPYWTMVARTTLGSMVLNGMFPYWTVIWMVTIYDRVPSSHAYWPAIQTIALATVLVYTVAMVWLGRRKLAAYQITGAAGTDILIETPIPLPRFVQEAFRCRPTEAVLNLVRKECRLMRPVWAMTLVSAITWVLIVGFHLVPLGANDPTRRGQPTTTSQLILFAIAIVMNVLIALMSGTVSLGDERASGTHAWHMTLPISARTQWAVKLLVGLLASVICGAMMPLAILLVRGIISGKPYQFIDPNLFWIWPLSMVVITVLGFWSACTVNGTLKASLSMLPILWGLALAGWFGDWCAHLSGETVAGWLFSRVEPFTFGGSLRQLYEALDRRGIQMFPPDPRIFLAPVFLLLFIQSYFLFRGRTAEGKLHIVRALVPGAVLTFVCTFLAIMPLYLFFANSRQEERIMEETHQAVEQWPGHELLPGQSMQIAGDDLAKSPAVSDRTRRWLTGATITLEPLVHFEAYHRFGFFTFVKTAPDAAHPAYLEKIHLQGGQNCTVWYHQYPLHPNVALTYSFPMRGALQATCN